jgi:RNA polymerase sigma-70 factor, ECF subfamily
VLAIADEDLARHRRTMFRFATTLSSLDDAEDIVQDALARAWEKRSHYDPAKGSLQSWLLAIVADQARSRWRRPTPIWDQISLSLAAEPVQSDSTMDLRSLVQALPARQRAAVILHHFVDLPVDEVAALLGRAPGTVKSALHDARRTLARELGASYARD